MKLLPLFILLGSLLFPANADHLLLTRVVTQPDAAESFSIYNPTDSPIELTDYFICDHKDYYKIAIYPDSIFSSKSSGFTAKFPPISIDSGDTLTIVLHENYNTYYEEAFIPDLVMFESDEYSSMLETVFGSIGYGNNKIKKSSELIILFKWDGINGNLIEDIDYFLWGAYQSPINKTGILTYQNDTPAADQLYFEEEAALYYAYSRIGTDEIGEIETGGNGITENDETSENFRESWGISEISIWDVLILTHPTMMGMQK